MDLTKQQLSNYYKFHGIEENIGLKEALEYFEKYGKERDNENYQAYFKKYAVSNKKVIRILKKVNKYKMKIKKLEYKIQEYK